ncbi:hypothetical protein [Bacillus sp. FJAT-27245]|uniref:hypothetical protein n=1 Tax=Bacillus sp. FJAT-27245 TaxID=1684144 RepID=UPI000AF0A1D9|nr:hypothetical protein [Bacillus sp. FJAT-27245]
MDDILMNVLKNDRLDDYPLFKKYCVLKDKGLRKDSFQALSTFNGEAKRWGFKKQQDFARWLFGLFEVSENNHELLVHPLEENLLKPILKEWMNSNPDDPRPYRWYALYLTTEKRIDYLNKALELGGSSEQTALLKLIDINLDSLSFSIHHITEDAYLGDIKEDSILITKSQQLNGMVECRQTRKTNDGSLIYYRELERLDPV